mgnify:CR=1 FL=1
MIFPSNNGYLNFQKTEVYNMTMMMATQAMKKSTNRNKNIGMQWEKRFIWNFIVRSAKNSGLPTWD